MFAQGEVNHMKKPSIEDLKGEIDFDFQLVQGIPHEEARQIYSRADVIVDQLLTGSYGLFSIEAMAMGKPVVTWISDFMKKKYSADLPIVSANPDTIKETLRKMLTDRDQLDVLGRSGRSYVGRGDDGHKKQSPEQIAAVAQQIGKKQAHDLAVHVHGRRRVFFDMHVHSTFPLSR